MVMLAEEMSYLGVLADYPPSFNDFPLAIERWGFNVVNDLRPSHKFPDISGYFVDQ